MILEKARRDTSRAVVLHQNSVKQMKMKKLPDSVSIKTCLSVAPPNICELLGKVCSSVAHQCSYGVCI